MDIRTVIYGGGWDWAAKQRRRVFETAICMQYTIYVLHDDDDHRPIIAEENLEKIFLARNYISFISQT